MQYLGSVQNLTFISSWGNYPLNYGVGPWFKGISSSTKPLEPSVLLTLQSAAPSEETYPLVELYARTLYLAVGNDVWDRLKPPPVPRHKPSPQTAPIVRTRFVTTHNNVGFARKETQTISFIEHLKGRPWSQNSRFFVVFIHN